MNPSDRGEAEVRRLLEGPLPVVPPELGVRAAERGERLLRRRRLRQRLLWLLLLTALVAFAIWASIAQPWTPEPLDTAPPLEGW
jgi:hypothetical protein